MTYPGSNWFRRLIFLGPHRDIPNNKTIVGSWEGLVCLFFNSLWYPQSLFFLLADCRWKESAPLTTSVLPGPGWNSVVTWTISLTIFWSAPSTLRTTPSTRWRISWLGIMEVCRMWPASTRWAWFQFLNLHFWQTGFKTHKYSQK